MSCFSVFLSGSKPTRGCRPRVACFFPETGENSQKIKNLGRVKNKTIQNRSKPLEERRQTKTETKTTHSRKQKQKKQKQLTEENKNIKKQQLARAFKHLQTCKLASTTTDPSGCAVLVLCLSGSLRRRSARAVPRLLAQGDGRLATAPVASGPAVIPRSRFSRAPGASHRRLEMRAQQTWHREDLFCLL